MERDELAKTFGGGYAQPVQAPTNTPLAQAKARAEKAESELARLRREIEALCEQADYANERGVWVWDIRRILGTEGGKP